jgi:uncharacterized membrane protein
MAAALALAYLLYAPMHGPSFFDFHWLPLSIPLLFGLFWALAAGRSATAWGIVVVLLLVREDVSIGLVVLGVFLAASGARRRFGVVLAAVALAWFVLVKGVIMPAAGPAPFDVFHRALMAPGGGYGSILGTLVTNPVFVVGTLLEEPKLVYALHLLAPLAFLPLRRPALLLLALPGFVTTLLTSGYGPTISIAFQYTAHWIPYLFGGCVLYLSLVRSASERTAAVLALCLGVTLHSRQFGAVLQQETFVAGFERVGFSFDDRDRDRLDRFAALSARIPPDASVAATEREVPHLSTRRTMYTLALANGAADYLLVARDHMDTGASKQMLDAALASGAYRLVASDGPFLLFEKQAAPVRSPGSPEAAPAT